MKSLKIQNKNRLIEAGNKLMIARGVGGWVEKAQGVKSTNLHTENEGATRRGAQRRESSQQRRWNVAR